MNERLITHTWFVEQYCRAYHEAFQCKYFFNGGKDGAAAKRFVEAGLAPELVIRVMEYAFSQNGYPWDAANSIATFVSGWSRIYAEYVKRHRDLPQKPASRWALTQQLQALEAEIINHPHNYESTKFDREAKPDIALDDLKVKLCQIRKQLAMAS
jgi:hypothetical protein